MDFGEFAGGRRVLRLLGCGWDELLEGCEFGV